jgi:hypothetical protein
MEHQSPVRDCRIFHSIENPWCGYPSFETASSERRDIPIEYFDFFEDEVRKHPYICDKTPLHWAVQGFVP